MGGCGSKANVIACDVVEKSRRLSSRSSRRISNTYCDEGSESVEEAAAVVQVTLDDVLKSVSHCQLFEKFIFHAKKSAKGADLIKYKLQLNFLHFCLDVRDYQMIPSENAFRRTYAQQLFDSYLVSSSVKSIAVSSSDARAIEIRLLDEDQQLPDDLFNDLLHEGKEMLMPSYNAFVAQKGTRSSIIMNAQNGAKSADQTQSAKLRTLVKDLRSARYLMEFLEPRGLSESVLLLMDVTQYEDTVDAYDHKKHQDDHFLYHDMHRIYSKYIKTGSKLDLSTKTLEDVQAACSDQSQVQKHAFQAAVDEISALIVHDHLADFLDSPAYQDFCHNVKAIESRRTQHRVTMEKINKEGLGSVAPNAPTLKEILETNRVTFFHEYMKETAGGEPVLLFWQEVAEFKRLPHTQTNYIAKQAKKIFNKFIKRGAKEEISLPAGIRADIMSGFNSISLHIFDAAQTEVQCEMDMDWYVGFLTSPLFGKMMSSCDETSEEQEERRQKDAQMSRISLREVLDVPEWQELFHKYLVSEDCGSILLFYVDVSNFQQLPKSSYLVAQSKKIYAKYIAENAKERMKLSEPVVKTIQEHLNYPSPAMYVEAQKEVLEFMSTEMFRKFRDSPFFHELDPNALRANIERQKAKEEEEHVDDAMQFNEDDMTTFLTQPEYRKFFVTFCEKSLCAENIYFWIDCEDFKLIPSDDYVALTARKIYTRYVKQSARNQVNLKDTIVKEIEENLKAPKRTLFIHAQEEIANLMETDTFAKFKQSAQMKEAKRLSMINKN